ncbi:MAG: hypothetical protein K8T90_18670 [Planctomycetes bacterium]|nr:hypothetical protein [Planctomycetota bacterium]
MSAARTGNDDALRLWSQDAVPILQRRLLLAGFDPASADDAITHLLEQSHCAVLSKRQVRHEAVWMRAVLVRSRTAAVRRACRDARILRRCPAVSTASFAPPLDAELREELTAVAAALPESCALAVRLRLSGMEPGDARRALAERLGVGEEQARKIVRCAFAKMREGLARHGTGRDGTGRDGTGRDGTGRDGTN